MTEVDPSIQNDFDPTVEYGTEFFDILGDAATKAAKVVFEYLGPQWQPTSVVDIGCGNGAWLLEARRQFKSEVLGVDGPWNTAIGQTDVPFVEVDMESRVWDLPAESYDLAICLEVAEHLTPTAADSLIDALVGLSDVVLFSAAVERQPGVNHINCRWQSEWMEMFRSRGFVIADALRSELWANGEVAWWYKQNLFLALKQGSPLLANPEVNRQLGILHANVIHPDLYLDMAAGYNRAEEAERLLSKAEQQLAEARWQLAEARRQLINPSGRQLIRGAIRFGRRRLKNLLQSGRSS